MTEIAYTPRGRAVQPERTVLGGSRHPNAVADVPEKKKAGETIDKVVGRIPTLYVIIFAAIVTLCAVLIIWNTLQVNILTQRKAQLDGEIELAKQRIIKLKAEEMQLSAGDRIRQIAKTKFGMIESDGINEFKIPTQ
ncbi:MAG TPA: cell division protein FtsL [Candidatus Kapabacteria bacterium]|nr:cell division protein FtsL [Candidatus Kapabacteria bacterium]